MIITSSLKNGYDSWVDNTGTNQHVEHGSGSAIQLQSDTKRGFVWLPINARIIGTTVSSAILTAHAHGATAAQTITIERVAAKWEAGKVNWANQPGVTGASATAAFGALADGAELAIPITSLVSAVAAGASHFGWRIKTSVTGSTQKLAAFNSGDIAFTLTIEFGEAPDPPTGLAPDASVVAAGKPVVTWDSTDFGGLETDIAFARVQVDTNLDGTVDWDSGFLPQTVSSMDLAAAGMTGTITSGQSVKWRVAIQDDDGGDSAFSDWAIYTYRPQPTLTIDSPSGGTMYDPTSDVLAHISTSLLDAYRIQVTDGADQTSIRYDSGKKQATDPSHIALALPLKNRDGSRIFTDDNAYQVHVRAWDSYDRQSTPGLPAHVDQWETVTFNDDLALSPVTSYHVSQLGDTPFVQHTWTDTAAGDAYVIARDGVHIARLLPADTVTGSSGGVTTFAWVEIDAAPLVQHVYTLRRITVGTGRSPARTAAITLKPKGVWLLRQNGDYAVFDGDGIDQLTTAERRSRYQPRNLPYEVDILDAYEGISGPLALSVEEKPDQTVAHAKKVLDDIKDATTESVQLIFAAFSKPVLVKYLTVLPAVDFTAANNKHRVEFTVTQNGNFDHKVSSGGGSAGIG